jgi:heat shock protein HtpX
MTTKNAVKTAVLLAALTGLFLVIGQVVGGRTGMLWALGFALLVNAGSYWFSDRLALAMAHARAVGPNDLPELWALVNELASRASVPSPRLYVIDEPSPNAFATGRNPSHAAVAVTTGLMSSLQPREIRAVLAHEFAHIKNRDILLSSIAATVAGAITAIAHFLQFSMLFGRDDDDEGAGGLIGSLLIILVAPIAATLLQLALSRAREFSADALGARLSGDPLALADALRTLEQRTWLQPMEVNPAAAGMFIVHPFAGNGVLRLFQTHPPTEQRIARLEAMAKGRGSRAWQTV